MTRGRTEDSADLDRPFPGGSIDAKKGRGKRGPHSLESVLWSAIGILPQEGHSTSVLFLIGVTSNYRIRTQSPIA